MLFTPAAPPRTVQYVPGHNRWHPDIPPVAEVIAGGTVRLHYEAGGGLCGPVGMVAAEPGDLVMVELLGLGRRDGRYAGNGHPGILGCAPSHSTVVMPLTTSSLDATVAGVTPHVRVRRAARDARRPRTVDDAVNTDTEKER